MMNKPRTFSTLALLGGCASALALAAACTAPSVRAQGFQGSGTIVSGGGSPMPDMITVNGSETVIDWAPTNTSGLGNIDFLPANNTAVFSNNPSEPLPNYTVLNRILPTDGNGFPVSRVIELNGTVQSQVYQSISSQPVTGGSIWFYSPGGIIAGPNSVFNVGSLVLTTNEIDYSNGLDTNNNPIRFQGAAGSNAAVQIMAGAQINALAAGSYVALVAPRVVQAGTVTVNGSTAYVGAEAVDISINGGMFDISVTAGTTDGNGVVHSGKTASPTTAATDEPHRVFMVAVPKNNALTMLLSGTIGYTPALSAVQDNHAVILSAGYDIAGGYASSQPNPTANADSGFSIGASDWQSHLTGVATGAIKIAPGASGSASFLSDVNLTARNGATGGRIDVEAIGGTSRVSIAGDLVMNVVGVGASGPMQLIGGDGVGGTINVVAEGGQIDAAGLFANASAFGGNGSDRAGNAQGGSITLSALKIGGPSGMADGRLQFGTTFLLASADTAYQSSFAPIDGGNAVGGNIVINGTSGALRALDLGSVEASAYAGGGVASTGAAGSMTGGNITVSILDGVHEWGNFSGDVSTIAGYATSGGTYGATMAGSIQMDISGPGSLAITDGVQLYADTSGLGGGASGGTLQAGRITISPHDGGSFTIAGPLLASAAAKRGSPGQPSNPPINTPDIFGGTISIGAAGGTFRAAGLDANASAFAVDASLGAGNAQGGSVTLFSSNSNGQRGNFTLDNCLGFGCNVQANGVGASGVNGSNGRGGAVLLYSSDADFSALGTLDLRADGRGAMAALDGVAGRGGDSLGGSVTVESRAGTGTLALGTLTASASGMRAFDWGGYPFNDGDGGNSVGGAVSFSIAGGSLTADTVMMRASGQGSASTANCAIFCEGGGTTPFQAGSGQGGTGSFRISGGSALIATLTIDASGTGGDGEPASFQQAVSAIAGIGRGGKALLESDGGTAQIGALTVDASGTGGGTAGPSGGPGGSSGQGFGGRIELTDNATATNGGLHIIEGMTLTSLGAPLAGTSGIFVTGSANPIQVDGAAVFDSDGPLSFAFTGAGGIRAGSLTGTSGTGIDISHSGRPANSASLSAGSIQLSTAGDINAGTGALQADGDINILARQAAFGSVITTGTGGMSLTALNGLTIGTIRSGGALRLLAEQGNIVVGDLSGGGVTASNHDFIALARNIDLTGAFSINQANATAGNLTLRGVQQVGTGTATGDILVSGSNLASTQLTAGGTLTAISSTFATLSSLQSGGLLTVTAASDASLNSVMSSGGDVVINAGGLATLAGTISGRAITIGSGDIAIASTGQIGAAGALIFNATNGQGALYIGGGDAAGGYSLSAAELGRVAAAAININALGQGVSGSPNVFLRDLTVGTGILASGGVLTIITPGILRVDGPVGMTGVSGQGGLHLSAGNAIEVIAGSGAIDLRDANGGLGGVLTLTSPSVIAATLAAIGDLAGLSSPDAREQRLAQNDGVVSDEGILRAGSIQANVANSFFIQNTGGITDYADRRGFTTNSLSIATQGPGTQIAINGQIMGAAGVFVTGRETIPLASINGAPGGQTGGYAFGSTINGCVIGSGGSCTAVVVTEGRDSLESVLDPVVPVTRVFGLSLIGLRDIVTQGYPPLIDEPVTGAGNDDLWEQRCDASAGTNCAGNGAP